MAKSSSAEIKKKEEKYKSIRLPLMAHADDSLWIKEQLAHIPVLYRQQIAQLYAIIFFKHIHDKNILPLKRTGNARLLTNSWLLKITYKLRMLNKQ